MGCCLSKLTENYFASAMAANEMSKKIGMMGKYAPKEMKERHLRALVARYSSGKLIAQLLARWNHHRRRG